jgi:uncharacterized membrane protein
VHSIGKTRGLEALAFKQKYKHPTKKKLSKVLFGFFSQSVIALGKESVNSCGQGLQLFVITAASYMLSIHRVGLFVHAGTLDLHPTFFSLFFF